MKYITEYRDKELAKKLVADIAKEARPDRNYRLMEFCGGHTHVISRYGLEGILPKNVRMIHGPGCPVCVMPIGRIDSAIELALEHGVILCTYADARSGFQGTFADESKSSGRRHTHDLLGSRLFGHRSRQSG